MPSLTLARRHADKATQILGEWNTPEDAEHVAAICLVIAQQSPDMKYHSRGVRGYIRIGAPVRPAGREED